MEIGKQRLSHAGTTIMVYAMTGEGKTGQIGEMALSVMEETGKKTLLHTMDHGGYETIKHLVDEDVIDVVSHLGRPYPWEWQDLIARGMIPSEATAGEWIPLDPEKYGMVAFDGASGMADILMQDLSGKAEIGRNPTGQKPSINFQEGSVRIANNSPDHFGLVQNEVMKQMQTSFLIPVPYLMWTALARLAEQEQAASSIVGPQLAGKAQTANVPQIFNYTFRVASIPGNSGMGTAASSRIYLHPYTDGVASGSVGLVNPRGPVGETLPDFIEPASVSGAMTLIREARESAKVKLRLRLADARSRVRG